MDGGRSKNGGVIHSKVILVPQKILSKASQVSKGQTLDPVSQKYSASVFQNWHKIHFLLRVIVYCFHNN